MKKITIAALSALLVLALCVPVMAVDVQGTGTMAFGGASYDLSNNVFMEYAIDVPTNAQYYGLSAVHSGGNRMFATTSETSILWWKTVGKGNTDPDNIVETWTSGQFASPWASL